MCMRIDPGRWRSYGQGSDPKLMFESISETMEIMGDPDMMAALRRGVQDVLKGNLVPLDKVRAELG